MEKSSVPVVYSVIIGVTHARCNVVERSAEKIIYSVVYTVKLNHTSPRRMGFPRNDREGNREIAGSSPFPLFYLQPMVPIRGVHSKRE